MLFVIINIERRKLWKIDGIILGIDIIIFIRIMKKLNCKEKRRRKREDEE